MDIPARVKYTLPKQSTVRQIHAACYGKQLTDPSTEKKRRPEIQFALEGGGDNKTKQHDIKMLLTFFLVLPFYEGSATHPALVVAVAPSM